MSFIKTGSPQPLNVMPEICQICGKNKAEFSINGQMICSSCKQETEKESKEKSNE